MKWAQSDVAKAVSQTNGPKQDRSRANAAASQPVRQEAASSHKKTILIASAAAACVLLVAFTLILGITLGKKKSYSEAEEEPTSTRRPRSTATPEPEPTPTPEPEPTPTPEPEPTPTPIPALYGVSVGEEIQFGQYEQDNNSYNGSEPITWIVLDKQGGQILVLSKYVLDSKAYHAYTGSRPNITWAQCTLREWLNTQFYDSAFNETEKDMIAKNTVYAHANPNYPKLDPGNDVEDRIFILSVVEANRLFRSDYERLCQPTQYALACGADTEDTIGTCWWWLRSPGHSLTSAAFVSKFDGSIETNYIGLSNVGIRPAMWINCP